jgi:putative ABC transport system substrate-binding protein
LLLPAVAGANELPLVGLLASNARTVDYFADNFPRHLARLGWEEGKTYRLQSLTASGDTARLSQLAAELVQRRARVIVGVGNQGVRAVQEATQETPIVGLANDMVAGGLVQSMARPGGNTTGVSIMAHELDTKRLEILHAAAPQARRIGVLLDPIAGARSAIENVEEAASRLGLQLIVAKATTREELPDALQTLSDAKMEALAVLASPFFNAARTAIISHTLRTKTPAVFQWPEMVEDGGLSAYGPRLSLCYFHVAVLVNRILRGARPSDLPVEQPTTFTLALNARTARAIDLQLPSDLLLRADLIVD